MSKNYHPESYWTQVAQRIKQRDNNNVIAGDDEPYYRYKRLQFLNLLNEVDLKGKSVLEVGCGPGGNLQVISSKKPSKLVGVDISSEMVNIARSNLSSDIKIEKINGEKLPFEDKQFDVVFTATVLQHNTDRNTLQKLMAEICRVSNSQIFLFERIESKIKGDELCEGRPITYYEKQMELHSFKLISTKFINVRVSYYVAGITRKLLNPRHRQEGEPLTKVSTTIQKIFLPFSTALDKVFKSDSDICRLEFQRKTGGTEV